MCQIPPEDARCIVARKEEVFVCVRERDIYREIERERERDRDGDRERDRETERDIDRQKYV